MKKTIPFTIASKRIKYLRTNLTKEGNHLYTENFKILMKEVEKGTSEWEDSPCSCAGRVNIGKMATRPKATCRSSAFPIKIPGAFFTEIEQTLLKFVWNHKRLQRDQVIWSKSNEVGSNMLPDFKLRHEALAVKAVMVSA